MVNSWYRYFVIHMLSMLFLVSEMVYTRRLPTARDEITLDILDTGSKVLFPTLALITLVNPS